MGRPQLVVLLAVVALVVLLALRTPRPCGCGGGQELGLEDEEAIA